MENYGCWLVESLTGFTGTSSTEVYFFMQAVLTLGSACIYLSEMCLDYLEQPELYYRTLTVQSPNKPHQQHVKPAGRESQ